MWEAQDLEAVEKDCLKVSSQLNDPFAYLTVYASMLGPLNRQGICVRDTLDVDISLFSPRGLPWRKSFSSVTLGHCGTLH